MAKVRGTSVRTEKLPDGTGYTAAEYYTNGTPIDGLWQVGLKIDGIRYIRNQQAQLSTRQGTVGAAHIQSTCPQVLHNVELFRKDWATSMSLKAGTLMPTPEDFYSLEPIDQRLILNPNTMLTHEYIMRMLKWVRERGHEGLVLRQGNRWLKVKPVHTADVRVTGYVEGTGKEAGLVASLTTNHGRVRLTGNVEFRKAVTAKIRDLIGKICEVEFMEWTDGKKMRSAKFVKWRFDKDEENDYGQQYD